MAIVQQRDGPPLLDVYADSELDSVAKQQLRADTQDWAMGRAISKRVVTEKENALIRPVRPTTDLTLAGATNNRWLTPALVVNTAATYINAALPTNMIAVFYGFAFGSDPNPAVEQIFFQMGAAAATTLAFYHIQHIRARLENCGYFTKAILYDPSDTVFITIIPDIAKAGGEELVLRGYVVEPIGQTVSAPVV